MLLSAIKSNLFSSSSFNALNASFLNGLFSLLIINIEGMLFVRVSQKVVELAVLIISFDLLHAVSKLSLLSKLN